jgi:hypothetical protein
MSNIREQILGISNNASLYLHIEERGVSRDAGWTAGIGTHDISWVQSYGYCIDVRSLKRALRPSLFQRIRTWLQ